MMGDLSEAFYQIKDIADQMLIDEEDYDSDYEELYFLTYNTLLTKSGIAATSPGR